MPSPTADTGSAATVTLKLGETFKYRNGLSLTVSAPAPFKPSQYSLVEGAAAHLSFQVTIVNGSSEPYDPATFNTSAQSGNIEADEVFDTAHGFEGSPSTTILPGRESTFKIGYGVSNAADVVMEARPGYDYRAAIFTS